MHIKGEINSNTTIVQDFNTTLTSMDRSSRQKINMEIMALNVTVDQIDLIDIYIPFHPKLQNTHFSQVHMEHSPGQTIYQATKPASKNSRRLKLHQAFFYHDDIILEIHYRKKIRKNTNTGRINNILLNNQWNKEEIKQKIKNYLETNGNQNITFQNI